MSVAKKVAFIVGAPLTLAAVLGGAAVFASQGGGNSDDFTGHHGGGFHRIAFHEAGSGLASAAAHDGSDCPYHSGAASTDTTVSPGTY
jgi:hypothetical protein